MKFLYNKAYINGEWIEKENHKKLGQHALNGQLLEVQSKIRTCQHCNKEVQGGIFFRWHGDNCKYKL